MKKFIVLILIVNLSLALTQVVLSAKRATDGQKLASLYSDLNQVEIENSRLKTEIYKLSSLTRIQDQAVDLQFNRVTTKFLNLELPVAKAQ